MEFFHQPDIMHTRLLPLALALALLSGCAGNIPLKRDQIGRISAETSPAELTTILGKATASADYDFKSHDQDYHARHYLLQTGTTQTTAVVCTPACIPILIDTPVFEQYVLVQAQPSLKLVGWGTIEELGKNPDERVSSLIPDLKKAHEQVTKKK